MFKITALQQTADDVNTETLTGDKTLTVNDVAMQILDPGGSNRNVVLPAEEHSVGLSFVIRNSADAAEILTVQNDASGTVCTPTQNETALVWCNGVTWYGITGFHN